MIFILPVASVLKWANPLELYWCQLKIYSSHLLFCLNLNLFFACTLIWHDCSMVTGMKTFCINSCSLKNWPIVTLLFSLYTTFSLLPFSSSHPSNPSYIYFCLKWEGWRATETPDKRHEWEGWQGEEKRRQAQTEGSAPCLTQHRRPGQEAECVWQYFNPRSEPNNTIDIWFHCLFRPSFFSSSCPQDLMLEALGEKVAAVHRCCVDDRMTNISTLEKLTNIEKRMSVLLQDLESIPEDSLEMMKKIKDSERRSRYCVSQWLHFAYFTLNKMREQIQASSEGDVRVRVSILYKNPSLRAPCHREREKKLREQQEKQKERTKRYTERSLADSRKIVSHSLRKCFSAAFYTTVLSKLHITTRRHHYLLVVNYKIWMKSLATA